MAHYTEAQYKSFIDRFLIEYPKYDKILDYPFFWEADIFSLKGNNFMKLVVTDIISGGSQLPTIQIVRTIIKSFYDWCEKNNIIQDNVCNSQYFDLSIWYDYAVDLLPIKVYYPEDIDSMISFVKDNPVNEVIIRLIYEGIEKQRDLISIKNSDIHLDEKYIDYRNGRISMSDKLVAAIKEYNIYTANKQIDVHVKDRALKKGITQTYQYDDYFFKCTKTYNSFEDYYRYIKLYMNERIAALEKLIGFSIKTQDIYASGFINFIHHDCVLKGHDDVYFSKILALNSNRYMQGQTGEYSKAYSITAPNPKVRFRFFPYVKKSRYYQV